MENNRRRQRVNGVLDITSEQEFIDIDKATQKEERRREKKNNRRLELESSPQYQSAKLIKTVLDEWYVDAIAGLFLPGIGDAISSAFSIPFIYLSLFKIKSIPLTLAIIYNILMDTMLGMIPFFIGDAIDFLNKAFKRNYRLVVGFVEDDAEIIRSVNRKAFFFFIMLGVFVYLIYLLFQLGATIIEWIRGLF